MIQKKWNLYFINDSDNKVDHVTNVAKYMREAGKYLMKNYSELLWTLEELLSNTIYNKVGIATSLYPEDKPEIVKANS